MLLNPASLSCPVLSCAAPISPVPSTYRRTLAMQEADITGHEIQGCPQTDASTSWTIMLSLPLLDSHLFHLNLAVRGTKTNRPILPSLPQETGEPPLLSSSRLAYVTRQCQAHDHADRPIIPPSIILSPPLLRPFTRQPLGTCQLSSMV